MNLVPAEYLNDTTYINLENNTLNVILTVKDNEALVAEVMQTIIENTEEFKMIDEINYKINNRKFIWTTDSGLHEEINIMESEEETEEETEEGTERYETTQE